jgi:hypothetical protein
VLSGVPQVLLSLKVLWLKFHRNFWNMPAYYTSPPSLSLRFDNDNNNTWWGVRILNFPLFLINRKETRFLSMQFHATKSYECMFKCRRQLATLCHNDQYMRWRKSSWFQTFALFRMLYYFFWVIPRRLSFKFRRFGTLCLFHLVCTWPTPTPSPSCLMAQAIVRAKPLPVHTPTLPT